VYVYLHKPIEIAIGGRSLKGIPHQDILPKRADRVHDCFRSDTKEEERHRVVASLHTARVIGHTARNKSLSMAVIHVK